jgi:hypothetical protein
MVDSWAAHGRGWVTFECSHLHDYLQLALMLRHPDLQIPHAAQGTYGISNWGNAVGFFAIDK